MPLLSRIMHSANYRRPVFLCLILIFATTSSVFVSASTPENLTATTQLSDGGSSNDTQVVSATDSAGNIHFVFTRSNLHLFYKMDSPSGQTLIDATQITNAGIHTIQHPDMAIDEQDIIHITWADQSGQHSIMYTALRPYNTALDGSISDDVTLSAIDDTVVSERAQNRD